MGSSSLKYQVRSFCNDSSVPPHLDDSPFIPFCSIFCLNLFFSSHLFPLHCQCFLIRSFTVSPHLLHFWDYHE